MVNIKYSCGVAVLLCSVVLDFASAEEDRTMEFDDTNVAYYSLVSKERAVPFTASDRVLKVATSMTRIVGRVNVPADKGVRVKVNYPHPHEVSGILDQLRRFGNEAVTEMEMNTEGSIEVLRELEFHKELRFLEIGGSKDLDTQAGRTALAKLTKLEYLAITPTADTNSEAFAKLLATLPNLKQLRLSAHGVNDDFVALICDLKKLEVLELFGNRTEISAKGLRHFQSLTNLRQLSVICLPDVQVADLEALAFHRSLRRLRVITNSPHLDRETIEAHLHEVAPHCRTRVSTFVIGKIEE